MAVESSKETGEAEVESLIDELIRDILNESGVSAESSARGLATTAALFETAFGSPKGASRISTLERLLVAQAFAAELADALAPALAEQLAPRLLKALEQFMTTEASKKPTSATRAGSQARKSDTKSPGEAGQALGGRAAPDGCEDLIWGGSSYPAACTRSATGTGVPPHRRQGRRLRVLHVWAGRR
jgi:hypothetical protein